MDNTAFGIAKTSREHQVKEQMRLGKDQHLEECKMTFGNGNCQQRESCRGSVHSKHIKKSMSIQIGIK